MESAPARFPAVRLRPRGEASRRLLAAGVTDLRGAIRFVRDLPYGRPSDPDDYLAVPVEGVGTCSTKHALLAAVCAEQGVDGVALTLGIYDMTADNTPGVGPVLADAGLDSIPEAHCYLRYAGSRFDFTDDGDPSIADLRREEPIEPGQIGSYKREYHRAALEDWRTTLDRERSLEEAWSIREACIAALSADGGQ